MKNLPHRQCHIAVLLEILRHRGIVSCMYSPVGIEIIQPGGIWSASSKKRHSTGSTHSLLRREPGKESISLEQKAKHKYKLT